MDADLQTVISILKDEYENCNIPDEVIVRFANQLHNYIFVDNGDLNDILFIVYNFEQSMRAKGIDIGVGRQCIIYDCIINCLEINEENAKRLYESFLGYQDCQAFSYLMNEFEDLITSEQRKEILSIAREVFIESVWEDYV